MIRRRFFAPISAVALGAVLAGGLAAFAAAQAAPPRARGPVYDSSTEVTLKGTVEAVHQFSGTRNWAGTHLTLQTGKGTMDVALAPSWYLAQEKLSFSKGDWMRITGSKVTYQGGAYVIARKITRDGKTVTLRNARGFPVWSRGRRGTGPGPRNR